MARPSRVFTIPASAPFLSTLAQALLDGRLVEGFSPRGDPLTLASATVFLPTRRAARAFAAAILDELGGEAVLLPRIMPLRDIDDDELVREDAHDWRLPPAAEPTLRRLILARLALKFANPFSTTSGEREPLVAATPATAITLADDLARIFDDMTYADISFDALDVDNRVPAELDGYWQQSLEFLKIAHKGWLDHLAEKGLTDPTASWRQSLEGEAVRIDKGERGPFVVAGSTASIPAVAELVAAIARRPDGAVVLPGLDRDLDEISWDVIEGGKLAGAEIDPSPGHPQFGLRRLLEKLGIARGDIQVLGSPACSERERFLSEAFRPAATTDRWMNRAERLGDDAAETALSGISVIEAADPREEALVIALALRETLEEKEKSAALITPDRALARRVAAELTRWNIAVDDSAGVPLAETAAGRCARLAASAAAEGLAPVPLLALLRHPFADLGVAAAAIDALEITVLRGPRPAPGPEGLKGAILEARAADIHRRDPRARLTDQDWDAALDLAKRIGQALEPLLGFRTAKTATFSDLLAAHRSALQAMGLDLAAREREDIPALAKAFAELENAAGYAPALGLSDYAEVFAELIAKRSVRPAFDHRARIRILGPLEARLIDCERMVLGGLNEGVWPPETHADAWLNRPMRKQLGLDLPERRIGLSAHDFVQAMSAREVVLTRARRQNGVETVASRFLQRLAAVAPQAAWQEALGRGDRYLAIARASERPQPAPPLQRPQPTPPPAVRPTRLSVTDIETLVRDPYSIYARHVLTLEPLEEIDADPGAAERGTLMHEALAKFAKNHPEILPPDALDRLIACGRDVFASIRDFPGVAATWWPRLERVARWFVEQERTRRPVMARTLAEITGHIELDIKGRKFTLTARADRVDLLRDGSIAIFDYKTGEAPTLPQALAGLAPQLPLEAAIARAGGFAGIPAKAKIAEIAVMKLSGGDPPGEVKSLDPTKATREAKKLADEHRIGTCDQLAAFAHTRVEKLLAAFAKGGTPYHSIPRPKWRGRFGRYDHLARIKEWSAGEEGEE